MINYDDLKLQAQLELARRDFYYYCQLTSPDFYKANRLYLKNTCNELQEFVTSNKKIAVINMPPRFGKTRTIGKLVEWLLGKDNNKRIMTGSYNEDLSGTLAKMVRDTIATEKTKGILCYSDIFQGTKIKYGDATIKKWSLEKSSQANYLATSPKGTATGFGADIVIIDDLIKNSEEAYNENVLQSHIDWFNNTLLQRTEKNFKLIIVMTRWAKRDLAGYILENNKNVLHINYKAVNDDGTMLDDDILSREDFDFKTKDMNKDIVYANYMQEPIDVKGKLYSHFKTYKTLPTEYKKIKNYTDTADTGNDYLCSIDYMVTKDNEAYVLNIIYTKDPMEITEPAVAEMLFNDDVNEADIESNNGGRGFARNVERILRQEMGSNRCTFNAFAQTKNKESRIYSNSTWVMEHIYFPENWADRFPEYYKAMNTYQKEGKNAHDDAPDATTGVCEKTSAKERFGW